MKKQTRICKNPECGCSFETTNPKHIYCNLKCKNRAGYLRSQADYPLEHAMHKARIKNVRILDDLYQRGFFKVTMDTLKILGFNHNIGMIPQKDKLGRNYFVYGKIALLLTSSTECELISINQNQK